MNKQEFEKNLERVYDFSLEMNKQIGKYFESVDEKGEKRDFIGDFLNKNNLEVNEESILAVAQRLVFLREDGLEQFMKKNNYSEEKIENIKQSSYEWVREFYEKKFQELIDRIESEFLLTDFYLEILKGIHDIGLEMNKLQPKWFLQLNKVNSCLEEEFENTSEIIDFLEKNNLFDKGHNNELSERAYSILVKESGEYKIKTYPEIFPEEVNNVLDKLKKFRKNISLLEDEIYNQKQNYLDYLDTLISALSETDRNKLVLKWSEVDKVWLKITTPFQICHFFENYDDPYRNTVSIEWDLRLPNPKLKQSKRIKEVEDFYKKLFEEYNKEKYFSVYEHSLNKIKKIQLYLGKPFLYYASRLHGLFSAQVIPNDENISNEYGKKIFAFPDNVLLSKQSAPFMLLPKKIYLSDFVKYQRNFILNEEEKWKEIYDSTTVGHEVGHILWKDNETDFKMNKSGYFEYIEEFKATATAIAEFFYNEKSEIKKDIIYDLITRAVALIAWKELVDRRAYYCEALIALDLLFESGILDFDGEKLRINLDSEIYKKFKNNFISVYKSLAKLYLDKKDASEFLFNYIEIIDKKYLPKKKYIRDFTEHYYKLYQEYGNQIDKEDSKENYIKSI